MSLGLQSPSQLAFVVSFVVSGAYLLLWRPRSRPLPLPPGPPSYPLVGQLLSLPQSSEAQAFAELGAKLNSDIVSLSFFGTTVISLNSIQAAHDLLDKRPYIYSGRFCPPMIASPRLLNLQNFIAFMETTDIWKGQRRVMNSSLNQKAVLGFRPAQELETKKLLQRLLSSYKYLNSSDEFNEELHWVVGSILLDSIYGYEMKSASDQFLIEMMNLNQNLAQAILPSNFLVNIVPWLSYVPEWLPGAKWKKVAREWREQKERAMDGPYNWAKQRINRGADDYSIVAKTLKDANQAIMSQSESDHLAKTVGTALFAGGMETSTSSTLSFVLAMALHPEAQAKAQHEIDTVIGTERLPTAADRKNLPYTVSLMYEVLRWNPSTPIGEFLYCFDLSFFNAINYVGVPHVCMEDNEYRGYMIPKGTIAWVSISEISGTPTVGIVQRDTELPNGRAITRDENVYRSAESFNPDRFLDPAVPVPPVFGWGIRICPGQHFLHEMLFIEIVSILATFHISKYQDEDGCVIEPVRAAANNSAAYRPARFLFKLSPRSEVHEQLIRGAV